MVNPKDITADLMQERFSDALSARVGPGKGVSVSALAEQAGVDERTINGWRRRESMACLYKMIRVAVVLGPGFVNDVFAGTGLGGMAHHSGPESPDSFGVNADLSAALAMFGRHLADGRFDHLELAEQRQELGALHEKVGRWLAAYDAPKGATIHPMTGRGAG